MNRKETISILALLRAAYPGFYRDMGKQDLEPIVSLWLDLFADDDPAQVAAAVKALIASKTDAFPPTIGAVKDKMRQVFQPQEMTELEAWGLVRKALSNSGYNAQREFYALPIEIQSVVHAPEQLREWANMDESTVNSVVASNFQRSYRARAKQIREYNALPEDIKALSSTVSNGFALPNVGVRKEPTALPARVRTADDIKADMEATREKLAQAAKPVSQRDPFKPLSEAEFEARRNDAVRKLMEVGK